ncbi:uncharacterized protein LOC142350428 [Convolutriloba macropyga]|uniref:uncharacterized protein LOC142350428 n=1 Tax=Convolutriloba macropyga TaxID=536237 RepID=UPI003F524FD8
MAIKQFIVIFIYSSLILWEQVRGFHGTDENFLDGPRFLPNSLEVEVEVTTLQPTSVYYMAKCDGVWLEFVLTACNFETLWHASIDFFDLKKDSSSSSSPMSSNDNINSNNPQQSQSNHIHSWSAGRTPQASLINQFHRKIIRVDPEQSREGAYRLTMSGFMRNTTVKVFTSESEDSNYRSKMIHIVIIISNFFNNTDKSGAFLYKKCRNRGFFLLKSMNTDASYL